jgi:hypothetical protein
MAKQAIQLWTALISDAPDSELAKEGKKQVGELEVVAGKK